MTTLETDPLPSDQPEQEHQDTETSLIHNLGRVGMLYQHRPELNPHSLRELDTFRAAVDEYTD